MAVLISPLIFSPQLFFNAVNESINENINQSTIIPKKDTTGTKPIHPKGFQISINEEIAQMIKRETLK
jgi:hypothetical protein